MNYLGVTDRGSLAGVVPMTLGLGVLLIALLEAHRRSGRGWREAFAGIGLRRPRAASAEPPPASSNPA